MDVLGLVQEAEQQDITAATFCQDLQTMKEILDAGGDINRRAHDGKTALMIAAIDDNVEGAKYLLFRGADMEITSPEGKTALQIADEFGSHSVLRLLRDAVLRVQRGMAPCEYKEPELIRNLPRKEVVSDPRFLGPEPKMSGGRESIKVGERIASNPFVQKDKANAGKAMR